VTYIYNLSKAPVEELREILIQPISEELELTRFISNPEYNYTEGKVLEVINTEIVDLKKGTMPLKLRIEYLKKLGAIRGLLKYKDPFVLDWILKRKDRYFPSLLDALMAPIAISQGMEKIISEDTRSKWLILLHARNPMCRLLAIKYVESWAKKEEYTEVLIYGLNDKYWWNRCLSLEMFYHLMPAETRFIIEEFLSRQQDKTLNNSNSMKEDLLNRLAINILRKLQEAGTIINTND